MDTMRHLRAALQVGATAADTGRGLRAKLAFVATMAAIAVFSIVVAFSPGRTILERIVDCSALGTCLAGVLALHISRKLHTAFGIVVGLAVLALAAFYFLQGNPRLKACRARRT